VVGQLEEEEADKKDLYFLLCYLLKQLLIQIVIYNKNNNKTKYKKA
jgi:hypothetical protein